MKVAVVHEWLETYAGSERVLEQILNLFPEAELFAVVDFLPEDKRAFLHNHSVRTTFIQQLPFARRIFRQYLPLMPLAIEQLDLSAYDLVLSSSHAVAKGVITGPDQLHISYVHSPIRYAWDLQRQYIRGKGGIGLKQWAMRYMLHKLRIWDCRTANGVDCFLANSHYIAQRILKVYGKVATVIYPPVDVDGFFPGGEKEDFYLIASRMVPYKRVDLIVEAFSDMPEKRLVVIGEGGEMERIKAIAKANVTFLGHQPFPALRDWMQRARAFLYAAEEDFGITLVEAQACGTPVIAYGRGGALETVLDEDSGTPTGTFFYEQTAASIRQAVNRFEAMSAHYRPEACRANAMRFSRDRFCLEYARFVQDQLNMRQMGYSCIPGLSKAESLTLN